MHVLQTEVLPRMLDQVFGVANADCAGRQEADGRLRVTSGSLPFTGDPARWSDEALAPGPGEVQRLGELVAGAPIVKNAPQHRAWGGLIDLTPDALPVLDAPDQVPGLVIGAGFSGHGFCLGPVSGEVLADLALDRARAMMFRPLVSRASRPRTGEGRPRSACTGETMLNPHGRVVLVSGANRGIGFAVAKALDAKGYTVSLGVRDPHALMSAIAHWNELRVHTAHYDATDWKTHAAWVESVIERFGRLDGLVNNAGISSRGTIRDIDEKELDTSSR